MTRRKYVVKYPDGSYYYPHWPVPDQIDAMRFTTIAKARAELDKYKSPSWRTGARFIRLKKKRR